MELYDITLDKLELNNVAGQKPDVVQRMSAMATTWQAMLPKGPMDPTAGKVNYGWPGRVNQGR